jgi:hypothetical protein
VSPFRKLKKMRTALRPGESLDPAQIASILDYDIQYGMARQGPDSKAIMPVARSHFSAGRTLVIWSYLRRTARRCESALGPRGALAFGSVLFSTEESWIPAEIFCAASHASPA